MPAGLLNCVWPILVGHGARVRTLGPDAIGVPTVPDDSVVAVGDAGCLGLVAGAERVAVLPPRILLIDAEQGILDEGHIFPRVPLGLAVVAVTTRNRLEGLSRVDRPGHLVPIGLEDPSGSTGVIPVIRVLRVSDENDLGAPGGLFDPPEIDQEHPPLFGDHREATLIAVAKDLPIWIAVNGEEVIIARDVGHGRNGEGMAGDNKLKRLSHRSSMYPPIFPISGEDSDWFAPNH